MRPAGSRRVTPLMRSVETTFGQSSRRRANLLEQQFRANAFRVCRGEKSSIHYRVKPDGVFFRIVI
jgi:hypothetical protein